MMFLWVLLIPLFFYGFSTSGNQSAYQSPRWDAMDILRERYARGEIDIAEFEERQRVLR